MPNQKARQNSIPKEKKPTPEMFGALVGLIVGLLTKLSFEQVKYWLGEKTLLCKRVQEALEYPVDPYGKIRRQWEWFYYNNFNGLPTNFSSVVIPPKPLKDSWRLIFIRQGLTMNGMYALMRTKFKVWTYTEDLDASVTDNTRTSAQSYAVWVRNGEDPDKEYLGKSTGEVDPEGKIGTTLLEHMVLEVKYFMEKGGHLDVSGVTLCTGSRDLRGYVPGVGFYPTSDRVNVKAYDIGSSGSLGGLRKAVAV